MKTVKRAATTIVAMLASTLLLAVAAQARGHATAPVNPWGDVIIAAVFDSAPQAYAFAASERTCAVVSMGDHRLIVFYRIVNSPRHDERLPPLPIDFTTFTSSPAAMSAYLAQPSTKGKGIVSCGSSWIVWWEKLDA